MISLFTAVFTHDSSYSYSSYSNSLTCNNPYNNSFCVRNSPYNDGFFLFAIVLIAIVFVCNSHNNSSVAPGRPDHQSDQKEKKHPTLRRPPKPTSSTNFEPKPSPNHCAPGQCSYKSPNREISSDMYASWASTWWETAAARNAPSNARSCCRRPGWLCRSPRWSMYKSQT